MGSLSAAWQILESIASHAAQTGPGAGPRKRQILNPKTLNIALEIVNIVEAFILSPKPLNSRSPQNPKHKTRYPKKGVGYEPLGTTRLVKQKSPKTLNDRTPFFVLAKLPGPQTKPHLDPTEPTLFGLLIMISV